MGMQEVGQEVLKEAEENAEQILAAAKQEAKKIHLQSEQEVAQYRSKAQQHYEELVASMERRLLAGARLDAQRILQTQRKELLAFVVHQVQEDLLKMNVTEKSVFLKNLLSKAEQEIEVDTVLVQKSDASLIKGKYRVEESAMSGGLIAQSKDGLIRVNYSMDELVQKAQSDVMVKLNEILFP